MKLASRVPLGSKRGICLLLVTILAALSFVLFRGGRLAQAQTYFGSIVGTVKDASQAAMPGVTITVTNTKTGIARTTTSDQYGDFQVGSLAPGAYTVEAEAKGFQVTQIAAFDLPVARTVTVNMVMRVGTVTQKVVVAATAPLLDTTSSTIGTVIDNREVVALPLNGRSYTDLILLVPGSVPRGPVFSVAGGHSFSVSGTHPDQTTWTLDGINNNENFFKQFAIQPSIDAIQEFKVQTNVTSAAYGGGAGANVAVALKSGTNQLHGALFEFLRNDKLDANEFFRNALPVPNIDPVTGKPNPRKTRPPFKQNQYGFVIGGPVYIPHVYDGRDRAFWLFNYEGMKIRRAATSFATVPTTAQLAGDLRDQPPIYDPATTRVDPVTGKLVRDPLSCNGVLNVICPGRINPATAAWAAAFYPRVSGPFASNNFLNVTPLQHDQYQINTRGDYKFTDKLSFFSRYSHATITEGSPQGLPNLFTNTVEKFNNAVASWTYVPSPTMVIDFELGVNRTNIFQADSNPAPGAVAYLAAHPLQGVPIKNADHPLYPVMGIPGFSGAAQSGVTEPTTDIQGILNLTKVMGRHTFKTGFMIDNVHNLSDNLQTASFGFSSRQTADPQNTATTGSGLASFLLGIPENGTRQLGQTAAYMQWSQYQFYAQDDLKLTSRLMLDLGLRYEYDQWPREKYGRLSFFDRTTGQFVWASKNPITGQPANIRPGIRNPDLNNFAPRIGLAYQLDPKTTIRSGYGIFYATNYTWEIQGARGQWPFALGESLAAQNRGVTINPVDKFFTPNTDVGPGVPPSAFFALGRLDRTSYSQEWNLGVQRQLANNLMLEVDYVATKGTKMPVFVIVNLPPPGPSSDPTHVRPFPQAGFTVEDDNFSSTNYNGLQVKLEKKFANGLQFLGSYAWAKYIDIGGGGNTTGAIPPNDRNFAADRGPGAFDFRHIFTGSYVYDLPFGRGKRFLSGTSGALNQLVDGWEITGITHLTTGPPVNVTINIDQANVGFGNQRPDRVLGQPARLPGSHDKTVGWLNPAAFAIPARYTFGNLGRNTERGPGSINWDIGIFKKFPLKDERQSFQFRAEFFNAFNQVNLGGPNAGFCQPLPACNRGFGTISGASSARQIQLALKYLF